MTRHEAQETAIRQVERFCKQRTPEEPRDEMRLEYEASLTRITIVERRAPWNPQPGLEWSRQPIAQLRYDPQEDTWTLYWPRSTGRWHSYEGAARTSDVRPLLAMIDADPHGVFWG